MLRGCSVQCLEKARPSKTDRGRLAVPPGLGRGRLGGEQLVERHDAGQRVVDVPAGGGGGGGGGLYVVVPLLPRAVLLVRLHGHDLLRLPPHLVLVQLEAGHDDGHDRGTGEHDEQRAEPVHRHAYAVNDVFADPALENGHGFAVGLRVRRERQVRLRDDVVQPADPDVRVTGVRHVHGTPAPLLLFGAASRRSVGRRRAVDRCAGGRRRPRIVLIGVFVDPCGFVV